MVKTGMVVPIYYTDLVAPSGEILVSRDVPELLPFTFYYKEIFGKLPSGIKYEALKAANMSSTNMTRMVLMPPKAPPETIAILRKAFDGLSRDQDFLQEAITAMRFQPRFEVGEAGERLFQRASQTRPRWLIFSASISKRQTSKSSIEFLIGVIQERSSESQWKILFLELISQHHHAIVAVLRTHVRRRLEQFQVGGGR